ncbi:MAG: DNA cytosine methyltransferase [Solirubrobacterales bacterium]
MTHALTSEGFDASEDGTGRGTPLVAAPISHGSNPNSNMAGRRREDDYNLVTMGGATPKQPDGSNDPAENGRPPISFDAEMSYQGPDDLAYLTRKLRRADCTPQASVRRLTPRECERLQGLPDDWTRLDETTPDSRRYAALGDAVTEPVGFYLGSRIKQAAA